MSDLGLQLEVVEDRYLDVDGPVRHEVRRRPAVGQERDRVSSRCDLIRGGHACGQLDVGGDVHLQTGDHRAVRIVPHQILGAPSVVTEGRAEVPSGNLISRVPQRHGYAVGGSRIEYRSGIGEGLLLQFGRVCGNDRYGQLQEDLGEVGDAVVDPDEPVQLLDTGACWDAEVEPGVHRFECVDDLGDDVVVVVEQVVGVDSQRVSVHPCTVRDLGVETQGDVDVSVVLDATEERGWPGVVGDYHVRIRQGVVAVDVECILGHLLEAEQQERVEVDALIRERAVRIKAESQGVVAIGMDVGHVPDQLGPVTLVL